MSLILDMDPIKKEILEKAKFLKTEFWSVESLKPYGNDLFEFYSKNFDVWIDNSSKLRHDYSQEVNLYFAYLYNSNFFLNTFFDRLSITSKKRKYDFREKVSFIKNVYENAYQHFGLLTISSIYQKDIVSGFPSSWFIPDKAKEFFPKDKHSNWKCKDDYTSGKNWAIENCPLFDFLHHERVLISIIRNNDSHAKLTFNGNFLFFGEPKQNIEKISIREFNSLFKKIRGIVYYAFHFQYYLLLKKNFWFCPAIIITNYDRFKFNLKQLPEGLTFENTSDKSKIKQIVNLETIKTIASLLISWNEFFIKDIWNLINDDVKEINSLLKPHGLRFDISTFFKLREQAIVDLINLFIKFYLPVKSSVYKKDFPLMPKYSIEDFKNMNHKLFYRDVLKTLNYGFRTQSNEDKLNLKIMILLTAILAFIFPASQIIESLSKAVVSIDEK